MKNLSLIAAVAHGNAIGRNGQLLCHMPADMRRFKELTTGHTVIMGRLTFESLPKGALPNRRNIVITRNPGFSAENAETAHSVEDALRMAESDDAVYVIGGAQIYRAALPFASRLCLTHIDADFPDADAFFPEFDRNEWREVSKECHAADEKNPHPYAFADYLRPTDII